MSSKVRVLIQRQLDKIITYIPRSANNFCSAYCLHMAPKSFWRPQNKGIRIVSFSTASREAIQSA